MATRTAYPATQSAGDVLTSTNFSKLPGGWIGYAEVTSDQGSIGTIVDLTNLTVTVTVNTDRRIRITGSVLADNAFAGANQAALSIRESTTTLGQGQTYLNTSGSVGDIASVHASVVLTPTAGSHTYKLSMAFNQGSSNTMGAGATFPAFILVEDIGPAT